jgi:spore germination protein
LYIHTVRAGETLYSIAQEYSASVADLILFNGLTRVNRLAVGQSLAVLLPSLRHLVETRSRR